MYVYGWREVALAFTVVRKHVKYTALECFDPPTQRATRVVIIMITFCTQYAKSVLQCIYLQVSELRRYKIHAVATLLLERYMYVWIIILVAPTWLWVDLPRDQASHTSRLVIVAYACANTPQDFWGSRYLRKLSVHYITVLHHVHYSATTLHWLSVLCAISAS